MNEELQYKVREKGMNEELQHKVRDYRHRAGASLNFIKHFLPPLL